MTLCIADLMNDIELMYRVHFRVLFSTLCMVMSLDKKESY